MRIKKYSKDEVIIANREWQLSAAFIVIPLLGLIFEWPGLFSTAPNDGIPAIFWFITVGGFIIGLLCYRNITVHLFPKHKILKWSERTFHGNRIIKIPFEKIVKVEYTKHLDDPYLEIVHREPGDRLILKGVNNRKLGKKVKIALETFLMRNQ